MNNKEETSDKSNTIIDLIKESSPEILYYEDFMFDVPDKVRFLPCLSKEPTQEERNIYERKQQDPILIHPQNQEWKLIFDDLLNGAMERDIKYTFQEAIVDWRIIKNIGDADAIEQRMVMINDYLNSIVNNDWKDITGGGSVFDKFSIEYLPQPNNDGFLDYILKVKADGKSFNISERSKGCKWFFCFKIYTTIRGNRNNNGTLFLLDEPASNLHIHPQEKILDSLIELSQIDDVSIIYSTHSPFLIDIPNYKSTFIVKNQSNDSSVQTSIKLYTAEKYYQEYGDNRYDINLQPIFNSLALNLINHNQSDNDATILQKTKNLCQIFNIDTIANKCASVMKIYEFLKLIHIL